MYLVMRLIDWRKVGIEQEGRQILPLSTLLEPQKDGSVGFLLVFESYEDALKFAGDATLISEIGVIK